MNIGSQKTCTISQVNQNKANINLRKVNLNRINLKLINAKRNNIKLWVNRQIRLILFNI